MADVELVGKQKLSDTEDGSDCTRSRRPNRLILELATCVTFLLFTVSTGGAIFSVFYTHELPFNSSAAAVPESLYASTSSLFVLGVAAIALGHFALLANMPPLLGMLLAGLLLQNIGSFPAHFDFAPSAGTFLRKFAFLIILLRAGLGLDGDALRKLKGACVRPALLPCTVEAFVVAFASWLLFDLSPVFGLLLGFTLAAVSPAVVVPGMLDLQERKLGTTQGIPTLVTAAASIDDVGVEVVADPPYRTPYRTDPLRTVLRTVQYDSSSALGIVLQIIRSPLEVLAGGIVGVLLGLLLWLVPNKHEEDAKFRRMVLLLSTSSCVFFGSIALDVETIGPFAVLTAGFADGATDEEMLEERCLKTMWDYFAQPFLFSLIGYWHRFIDGSSVLFGVLVLLAGLTFRMLASYAALAPVLMDLVAKDPATYTFQREAQVVLTVAIISILLTTPVGACLIRALAPILIRTYKCDDVGEK
ncbi:mitochondrial sodium/hydrogen exchanger 9B2-like protein [Aphelenchoides avenae]|nr:mitochondrial sodium/hydrogen exchanger 9B2-like protein [Aphelenchus avenae]